VSLDSAHSHLLSRGYLWRHEDGGAGGGDEYDVYVIDLLGEFYGYAYPDAYLEIDNDYKEQSYDSNGLSGMQVTVVHELFHAFQFQYFNLSTVQNGGWWREATATFMEDQVYPDINDYVQYHNDDVWDSRYPRFLEEPGVPVSQWAGVSDVRAYGAEIFPRLLAEGAPDGENAILRSFEAHEAHSSASDQVTMGALTATTGRSMGELIAQLWAWAYFLGFRAALGALFSDAADITAAPPVELPPGKLAGGAEVTGTASAYGWGGALIEFPPEEVDGHLHITVSQALGLDWRWRIAVQRGGVVETWQFWQKTMVENWRTADAVVLIGGNGLAPSGQEQFFNYSVLVSDEVVGVSEQRQARRTVLGTAQPNPFNGRTHIPVTVSEAGRYQIAIYSALGQLVRRLAVDAGTMMVVWDGNDEAGRSMASGGYLYVLADSDRQMIGRVSLAR
ncbi:MAG: FlgD immunoglobulin-like domain containing protein, partial [Candidatus Latescibacteria bacterium]|nr:FlgD immunoglobulin-like domain containing protein [Candidatus Latescibacterota bacterium]